MIPPLNKALKGRGVKSKRMPTGGQHQTNLSGNGGPVCSLGGSAMKRWTVAAVLVIALPFALCAFGGCRHLGLADEPDGGTAAPCTPCSEYERREYWCMVNACTGVECGVCGQVRNIPEPSCVPDDDGGTGAAIGNDAGPGGCACDMTYGCDQYCSCDPDCSHPGGDAGASPCIGEYRTFVEDRLKTFFCEEYLGGYKFDACLNTAVALCPTAGGICETGYVYYVSGGNAGCACLPPGSAEVGENCSAPNDCIPGAICIVGEDEKHCLKVCSESGECGEGGTCVHAKGGFSVCYSNWN